MEILIQALSIVALTVGALGVALVVAATVQTWVVALRERRYYRKLKKQENEERRLIEEAVRHKREMRERRI